MLDQAEVQDDDGHGDKHAPGGKARKLRLRHVAQPYGDRPHLPLLEQELGEQIVAPRPCELRQSRIDEHRFGQRQRDEAKDLQVVRAVDAGGLMDGERDGVKIALLYEVAQRCRPRIQEDQRGEAVEQAELRHDDVDGGHAHESREHAEQQRRLFDRIAAAETKAGHDVTGEDDQQRADEAAHGGHVQGVQKPAAVRVQAVDVVGEQVDERIRAVLGREETGKRIDISRLGERREDQPETGEQKQGGDRQQQQVGDRIVGHAPGLQQSLQFH